jgi:RNA polymerase sigma factor (sigma-70 family)
MIDDPLSVLIEKRLIECARRLGRNPTLRELSQETGVPASRIRSKLREIQTFLKNSNQTLDRHAFFVAINSILQASPPQHAAEATEGQLTDLAKFKGIKDSVEEQSHASDADESDGEESPDDLLDQNTLPLIAGDIREVMAQLSPRERDVLRLRFGLDDGRQRTLEEVAKVYGVSRERIRQVEAKALRKLRRPGPPRRPG